MGTENQQKMVEAAQLLSATLKKLLAGANGVHAETLVSAAARMTGTMLYRSFASDQPALRPGSVVISEDANRYGPVLMDTLFATLRQLGHPEADERLLDGADQTTALSRLSLAQTQQQFEPWYRKTQQVLGLSALETAAAGAIATAMLIHECGEVLDLKAACAIAVHGLVESVKTVPAAFDEAGLSDQGQPA